MKNIKEIFKKIACFGAITLFLSTFFLSPAFAADNTYVEQNDSTVFLGLRPWNYGVTITDDEDSLKNGIWTIVANIAIDITIIAAYLAIGFVIYGGYKYMFSSGDPGKVAAGKKTLLHAFTGLAIVLSTNAIMSTIRFVLVGRSRSLQNCATKECINPTRLATQTIGWFIGVAGIVSAIFVVYGGISYMTSAGDPGKLQKAKQTLLYALIGLAIVALATTITAFVSNTINTANN